MIKWILFDGYGTLFDAGKENIPQLAQRMAEKYQITPESILNQWSPCYFALEETFGRNFMTIMQANRISLSYTFGKLQLPITEVEGWIQELVHLWSTPLLYEGVSDLFYEIRESLPSVQIGVISNTDEDTVASAIGTSGLPISYYISSERARAYKPDSKIFQKALHELQIYPDACIYIGNSVVDVVGSSSAGIRCIYLNRDNKPLPPDYERVPVVRDIYALKNLLNSFRYQLSTIFE